MLDLIFFTSLIGGSCNWNNCIFLKITVLNSCPLISRNKYAYDHMEIYLDKYLRKTLEIGRLCCFEAYFPCPKQSIFLCSDA